MAKTIGFVSLYDPFRDRKAWSGTIFKLRESIENAGFNVKWIPYRRPKWMLYLLGGISKLIPGNGHPLHNRFYFKTCAATIDQSLFEGCDYVFFPGGTQIAPYLNIKAPIIYFSDSQFGQMVEYYWTKTPDFQKNEGNLCEKRGIETSNIKISASDWAARNAETEYGFPAEHSYVIEFGPNLDSNDIIPNSEYEDGTLNILFSGVDWGRKGGAIAVETVKYLRKNGINANLHICGIRKLPKQYENLDFIKNHGFLNRNNPDEYNKYLSVWHDCHIFLLPTVAECAGIVFSESSGFGLPIFTHDTGGIPNYVIDGANGYRLPLGSTGEDFGKKILEVLNANKLGKLRAGALKMYRERLNWNRWSEKFKEIISKY